MTTPSAADLMQAIEEVEAEVKLLNTPSLPLPERSYHVGRQDGVRHVAFRAAELAADRESEGAATRAQNLWPKPHIDLNIATRGVGVCFKGKWEGWVFVLHVDGEHWTSGAKLTNETYAMLKANMLRYGAEQVMRDTDAAPIAAVPVSELEALREKWNKPILYKNEYCEVFDRKDCADELAALIAKHSGET